MKNGAKKRIRVYLEDLGDSTSYERLFRALSLILSEGDLRRYFSANRDIKSCFTLDGCDEKSEALAESLANS
jgi:hypothetical protein